MSTTHSKVPHSERLAERLARRSPPPQSINENQHESLSTRSLGGEIGLELRGVANLSTLTVARVRRPLATGTSRARDFVLLLGTAASALAGGTLV
jgi:hypothetical protein